MRWAASGRTARSNVSARRGDRGRLRQASAWLVVAAALLSAAVSCSGTTAPKPGRLQVSPSTVRAGATIEVSLEGVAADQLPVSGVTAALQNQKQGRWTTLYTLFVDHPVDAGGPRFVAGTPRGGNLAIGITDPAVFHVPPTLPPGTYRVERLYSYGPSGHTTQTTATGNVTVVP